MDGLPWGNGRAGTDRSNLVQAGDIVFLRVREDFKGSRLGFHLQWLQFMLREETWQGKKHAGKFYAEIRWFLSNMQVQSRAETIPLPLEKSGFQEVSAKLLRAAIMRINCYRIHLPQNGPLPHSVNTPLIGIITPGYNSIYITRPTLPPMCPIFGWQLLEADLKGIRFFLMQRPILMMRRNAEVQKTISVDVFTQGNIYYRDYYGMFLGWERSGKKTSEFFILLVFKMVTLFCEESP